MIPRVSQQHPYDTVPLEKASLADAEAVLPNVRCNLTATLVLQLYKENRTQPLGFRQKAHLLLEILLIDLARATTEESREQNRPESVYHYICYNYANRLNFRTLAAESGFSYDYFRRLFRQTYNLSPQKLQIEQRFSAARTLLEQRNMTVTEIAMRCGFADGSQFAHMFRQKYGISPRDYRNAAENADAGAP